MVDEKRRKVLRGAFGALTGTAVFGGVLETEATDALDPSEDSCASAEYLGEDFQPAPEEYDNQTEIQPVSTTPTHQTSYSVSTNAGEFQELCLDPEYQE